MAIGSFVVASVALASSGSVHATVRTRRRSRESPPSASTSYAPPDQPLELKGVRSGVERRSAFTTPTRSYGDQCIERTRGFRCGGARRRHVFVGVFGVFGVGVGVVVVIVEQVLRVVEDVLPEHADQNLSRDHHAAARVVPLAEAVLVKQQRVPVVAEGVEEFVARAGGSDRVDRQHAVDVSRRTQPRDLVHAGVRVALLVRRRRRRRPARGSPRVARIHRRVDLREVAETRRGLLTPGEVHVLSPAARVVEQVRDRHQPLPLLVVDVERAARDDGRRGEERVVPGGAVAALDEPRAVAFLVVDVVGFRGFRRPRLVVVVVVVVVVRGDLRGRFLIREEVPERGLVRAARLHDPLVVVPHRGLVARQVLRAREDGKVRIPRRLLAHRALVHHGENERRVLQVVEVVHRDDERDGAVGGGEAPRLGDHRERVARGDGADGVDRVVSSSAVAVAAGAARDRGGVVHERDVRVELEAAVDRPLRERRQRVVLGGRRRGGVAAAGRRGRRRVESSAGR
eukprot:30930-Pelagococcus_subviridis.AAC.2